RFLHRRHDRPVPPDRTELDPPPAEPERLQRATRDPDRGEQMPAVAADEGLAPEAVAAHPGDERSEHIDNDQQNKDLAAIPARHRHDSKYAPPHALLPEGQRDRPVEPRIRTAPPLVVVGPGSANVTDPLAGSVAPCASSIRAMADGFDVVAI